MLAMNIVRVEYCRACDFYRSQVNWISSDDTYCVQFGTADSDQVRRQLQGILADGYPSGCRACGTPPEVRLSHANWRPGNQQLLDRGENRLLHDPPWCPDRGDKHFYAAECSGCRNFTVLGEECWNTRFRNFRMADSDAVNDGDEILTSHTDCSCYAPLFLRAIEVDPDLARWTAMQYDGELEPITMSLDRLGALDKNQIKFVYFIGNISADEKIRAYLAKELKFGEPTGKPIAEYVKWPEA